MLYEEDLFKVGFSGPLYYHLTIWKKIEQKGMSFDHDFGYSFALFSSLVKKRGKKENEVAEII